MRLYILSAILSPAQSQVLVWVQKSFQQRSELFRCTLYFCKVNPLGGYLLHQHDLILIHEGGQSGEHLVEQGAQTPKIYTFAVALASDDLGCQVLRRTANCEGSILVLLEDPLFR